MENGKQKIMVSLRDCFIRRIDEVALSPVPRKIGKRSNSLST